MKNHIEERRKARGMTQQQLASELGVSRQTIISLENGKYNPSILLAHSIAPVSYTHLAQQKHFTAQKRRGERSG